MKNIIFINGTMGVGKTTVSQALKKILDNCVFLDGDWCWDMNPFIVNQETKDMVIDNITYMLNNFIKCSEFENIIFCWVMHEEHILEDILSKINIKDHKLYKFSLVSSKESLIERFSKDIENGIRTKDGLEKSMKRLNNYYTMDTIKIDVSNMNKEEVVREIVNYIGGYAYEI